MEEFILDRTLELAIEEFGLEGFKMIDPACGSGHFLLGAFRRIEARWEKHAPEAKCREVVQPDFDQWMDEFFEGFVAEEAKAFNMTIDEVRKWQPPKKRRK